MLFRSFYGRRVLDLGVGTGRTAGVLQPLAGRYVCIDYAREMVEHVRRVLPEVEVHMADMRDLSAWDGGAFDFIFGPDNVLDAVCHEDRLRVLAEVHRLLPADGLLMFSVHNRRYDLAQCGPRLEFSRNPVTQMVRVAQYLRRLMNHRRIGRLRRLEKDYAVLNDIGHDFQLLHYYIDWEAQVRQLEAAGFRVVDIIKSDGRSLRTGDANAANRHDDASSPSLMYVAARKQA